MAKRISGQEAMDGCLQDLPKCCRICHTHIVIIISLLRNILLLLMLLLNFSKKKVTGLAQ